MGRDIVKAEDIVADLVEESDEVAFALRDKVVVGKLDLKHREVGVALEINDCEFLGDVDLRYCEFAQAVDLSGCTFRGSFNSGDELESYTIYRKDLNCEGVSFQESAYFNGARVEGSAYFPGATFACATTIADFTTAKIGKTLEFADAIFRGGASFSAVTCGSIGVFNRTKFEDDVAFNAANFGSSLVCDDAEFWGEANFELVSCAGGGVFRRAMFKGEQGAKFVQAAFESNFECSEAIFEGPALLNSLRAGRGGFFKGAIFKSGVNLDYASFAGVLDCDGAAFHQTTTLNSVECATLHCEDTSFYGQTSFGKLNCKGSAYFQEARFHSAAGVGFGGAKFDEVLSCDRALFGGPADFSFLSCTSNAIFDGAQFRSAQAVSFLQSTVGGDFLCRKATFEGEAVFNSFKCVGHVVISRSKLQDVAFDFAKIGQTLTGISCTVAGSAKLGHLECRHLSFSDATFWGPANFAALECTGKGVFRRTKFYDNADFSQASIGVDAIFNSASFYSAASFDTFRCGGSGAFRGTKFEEVNFRYASFGRNMSCQQARFYGPAVFNHLSCDNTAFFNGAKFLGYDKPISWASASLGGSLECVEVILNGPVSLNATRCEDSALFTDARSMSHRLARFEYAHFGRNLNLLGMDFSGPIDMTMLHVASSFTLSETVFRGEVVLYGATIGLFNMEGPPLRLSEGSLDLRGCHFDGLRGSKAVAMTFVRAQDPAKFSRDPYLHLETHYRSSGDEAEAEVVHLRGRRDLRANAKSKYGVTEWSRGTMLRDVLWDALSGYTTRTWLLGVYILLFLVAGTWVFWSDSSVAPRISAPNEQTLRSSADLRETEAQRWSHPWGPVAYSVDIFVPVVNLRFEDKWEPVGQWRVVYSLIHALMGWLLVLLVVASLTGIVKR